jgi:NAD(P)H-dependent FMN reductase
MARPRAFCGISVRLFRDPFRGRLRPFRFHPYRLILPPMKVQVISCSMNVDSHAFLMAQEAMRHFNKDDSDLKGKLVDLRELQLPLADPTLAKKRPDIRTLEASIERASAILLSLPIYHYDPGAAAKNLVELTGPAWKEKVVGFMCSTSGSGAAGGRAYMAIMHLIAPLILEYRCVIVPKIVVSRPDDFSRGAVVSADVPHEVKDLVDRTARLAKAVEEANAEAEKKRQRIRVRL